MSKEATSHPSEKFMVLLSRLLFPPVNGGLSAGVDAEIRNISRADFDELVTLADLNHVIVRGLEVFLKIVRDAGDDVRAEWATTAIEAERARIAVAVPVLHNICKAFGEEGLDVTVIKSLDHWPDLGSDLDLYSNAKPEQVLELMQRRFQAQVAARSWGDRLARKWNFDIPGLPEAVEIHVGRLGQTGEQVTIASRLAGRARSIEIQGLPFRVSSISDRLMISTLQRMYRHFYFRLCDIVDSSELIESGVVDYEDLRSAATAAEIWEGTATYLVIVSDYVKQYRGTGLELPKFVTDTARFGGNQAYYARSFLRVPIMPQSAGLYGSQLTGLLRQRDLNNSARLGLLPWLATAAFVGQKLTGSDKGIW
jgi:protein-disulfide isomerase-like protein with CxxC motif